MDVIWDFHGFRPHKLQQGDGETGVPAADPGLGLGQIPPSALQIGGRGAVKSHVGQFLVQPGVVLGFDAVALGLGHQTLRDQLVGVGIGDALTGPAGAQRYLIQRDILRKLIRKMVHELKKRIKQTTKANGPDDLVHRRVGEKRLVQLVVTPLTVADQVQDDVFPEEPLVFYGQPSGSQHLLGVIAIDVDNGTIHHFT